jgi:hypothetical protein
VQVDGYIKLIEAGATQFNFAPDFKFEFIPVSSKMTGSIGIYDDNMDDGSELSAWMDIFKKGGLLQQTTDTSKSVNSKPVK